MRQPQKIPPPERPLIVFDGQCAFCRARVERWHDAVGEQIEFVPWQEVSGKLPQIDEREFKKAVHYIDRDGNVYRAAEAVFRAMAICRRKRWLLWLYTMIPPFAFVAEFAYRLIAANRTPITWIYRTWHGGELKPSTYHIASALFLRLLGLVYLIAFVSLWTQIDGLVGDHGILPVNNLLQRAKEYFVEQIPPASAAWNLPTLAWINPHNGFLHILCAGGTIASILLILGVLPIPSLISLWMFYLSLVYAGQVFMSFQWDILLLETGFVAIFLAPFAVRSRLLKDRHPQRLAIWLLWWLLFRLMFESGAVKLTWNAWQLGPEGTPIANTWKSLTALNYHYWTQPLPIWTSWYAAKLPAWFQKVSVVFVLLVELVLPWLIFGPRRLRYVAFGGITLLMFLIAATGNYNFFNLLAFALALMLLDDRAWPRFVRNRIAGNNWPFLAAPTQWRSFILVPFALFAILIGTLQLKEAIVPSQSMNAPLESKLGISQFFFINDYGLFRQMTETRPEIVVEGSDDGSKWTEYEFRWKPGDPSRRPRLCAPHQPRLDWQMWFEALRLEEVYKVTGTIDPHNMSAWFRSFLMRLMKGEPNVVGLLANNPFPVETRKFIRLKLYQYRFTNIAEGKATGDWWHRELVWTGPEWSPE
jgi:predicted DCC family thiol-disulfide oxidoreductase YuxK